MATEFHPYQAGDGDRLASQGLPAVLDMENSAGKAGPTGGPGGRLILDSYDEPRQPSLGRTADSRRTAQAWHCRRRNERQQVHDPQSQTTIADVANLPWKSRQDFGVCLSGAGSRPPPDSPLCCNRSSHGGVDPRSNSAKSFPGTPHPAICSAIGTGSSGKKSWTKSNPWG